MINFLFRAAAAEEEQQKQKQHDTSAVPVTAEPEGKAEARAAFFSSSPLWDHDFQLSAEVVINV